MNSLDLNYGLGFPFENKTMLFMQDDYKTALKGLAGIGGNGNFIVSGLIQTGSNVSDGWIYYNGELIYFESGVRQASFVIFDSTENKIYQDGVSHPAYITRHARFGLGTTPILFSILKRLPSLLNMQSLITSMIGFESAVIVSGCDVSGVVDPNETISAGIVLIDGNVINVAGYTGVYPVWINSDGNYVNAQPGVGSFIKFDPNTSQGKDSVIRRAINRVGTVVMMTVLSDRFDNTGLGKWEMTGFALMNGANGTLDIRGRVPLSYDGRGADPGGGIWDANYQAAGNTGGEKEHQLTEAELAAHNHQLPGGPSASSSTFVIQYMETSVDNPATVETLDAGGDQAHENRQPFMVLVYAQRI